MAKLERRLVSVAALVLVACSGGAREEDAAIRAKMAGDLVQCQNDRMSQKERIAELQAEIARLKAEAVKQLEPIDLKAGRMEGNIPPDKLHAVVKANSGGLRRCYESALKRQPDLRFVTSVNVEFKVKSTGEAFDVGFSPHRDVEMEKCMAAAIAKWKFPAFEGEPVQVQAPVNLIAK